MEFKKRLMKYSICIALLGMVFSKITFVHAEESMKPQTLITNDNGTKYTILKIIKGNFFQSNVTKSLKIVKDYFWADQNKDIIPRVKEQVTQQFQLYNLWKGMKQKLDQLYKVWHRKQKLLQTKYSGIIL